MRVLHRARVANFRPTAARALYALYSKPGDTVVDFSAGFGGRLLGAMTLQRHYLGIDPAPPQIRGLRQMATALRSLSSATIELHEACAEEFLMSLTSRSVDLVFSSPPYFDVERYSDEATQSYRRYPAYTLWRESFLRVIIEESYRILRRGGVLIMNVADVRGYPLAQDTHNIARRLFRCERECRLALAQMPHERSRGRVLYRWEPILVYRKKG